MNVTRGVVTLLGGALAAGFLSATSTSLPPPPLDGLAEIETWWRANGTAVAALAAVRIVGLALGGYVTLLGAATTLAAATRWSWAESLTKIITTAGARRLLMGGGLAAGLSVSSVGGATTPTVFDATDIGETAETFRLTDIGETAETFRLTDIGETAETFRLTDIGETVARSNPRSFLDPVSVPALDLPRSVPWVGETESGPAADSRWVVERGDHLWAIAAETIADRGGDGRESAVAAYWLELIELNRDVIGDDPDLIHPGQVIRLPD